MNPFDVEYEIRQQQRAEAAERNGAAMDDDADVRAYRMVMRAAAMPLAVALPDDFAARVAGRVTSQADASSLLERWAPGLALALLVFFGFAASGNFMTGAVQQLAQMGAGRLPWPLLCAAALALAAVGLSDRVLRIGRGE